MDRECSELTTRSGGLIRVGVKRYANPVAFVSTLRTALQGSRVQSAKLDALGEGITGAADPKTSWMAALAELEGLAEYNAERGPPGIRPGAVTLLDLGLNAGDIDRIAQHFTPENWLALSLTPIASVPVYEFRTREAEYIPFENASAGQQATALLKTLLNQPGPPLIIDQPEEDLDNPVMLEIVNQLWDAKRLRQIVFASHNANLVVNGDAELVAWFQFRAATAQRVERSARRMAGAGLHGDAWEYLAGTVECANLACVDIGLQHRRSLLEVMDAVARPLRVGLVEEEIEVRLSDVHRGILEHDLSIPNEPALWSA